MVVPICKEKAIVFVVTALWKKPLVFLVLVVPRFRCATPFLRESCRICYLGFCLILIYYQILRNWNCSHAKCIFYALANYINGLIIIISFSCFYNVLGILAWLIPQLELCRSGISFLADSTISSLRIIINRIPPGRKFWLLAYGLL